MDTADSSDPIPSTGTGTLGENGVLKKKVTRRHRRPTRTRTISEATAKRGLARLGRNGSVSPAAAEKISNVIDYIIEELVVGSMTVAYAGKKATLSPAHLRIAISQDAELSDIFDMESLVVPGGGFHVVPNAINDRAPTAGEKRAKAKRQRQNRAK